INLNKQLDNRSISNRLFRVAIVGAPNAGKSSLFNALAGRAEATVSPTGGATRDYVSCNVPIGVLSIELVDTAGWHEAGDSIEQQAQALGRAASKAADLILWCFDATQEA